MGSPTTPNNSGHPGTPLRRNDGQAYATFNLRLSCCYIKDAQVQCVTQYGGGSAFLSARSCKFESRPVLRLTCGPGLPIPKLLRLFCFVFSAFLQESFRLGHYLFGLKPQHMALTRQFSRFANQLPDVFRRIVVPFAHSRILVDREMVRCRFLTVMML
jgi:hypothetical protein